MKTLSRISLLLTLCLLAFVGVNRAYAAPICIANSCTIHINGDPNATENDFNGGAAARVGYTITLSDDGTSLRVVTVSDTNPGGNNFQNLYFDINPGTQNSSNLGFEATNSRAFIPGVAGYYNIMNAGYSSVINSVDPNHVSITTTIPNTLFTTDIFGRGLVSDGSVSLHLSQTFGYSVVGGSTFYSLPVELGLVSLRPAAVSTTPEPSSLMLLGTGVLGLGGVIRRRLRMS